MDGAIIRILNKGSDIYVGGEFTKADGVIVYELDAYSGFEAFSSQVNAIATKHGIGVYYVFDCLSDLLSAWATGEMAG